jgi:hypothetical protein
MIKEEVLKLAENAIRKQLGTLDDIPYELANTIANIYYRFFESALEAKDNPGWIPTSMKIESDWKHGLAHFIDEHESMGVRSCFLHFKPLLCYKTTWQGLSG